ncbi:lipopolysaccharide biosynthesis protein [Terrabacter aerolatus]|uniref:lipopolysaccharide biosynthesis protein n=1 Tax=Terrabacter aerolatus TaxID=422442 RepID=UPI0011BFD080
MNGEQNARRLRQLLLRPNAKRAGVLLSGAVVAQIVPIVASPLLTRLYTPSTYGALATFGAISAIVTAVATGRYHMATTLPVADSDARAITSLSLRLSITFCGLLTITALAWFLFLPIPQALRPLGIWMVAIPLAGLLGSIYETLTIFSLRHDATKVIAKTSAARSVTGAGAQAILGVAGAGIHGLIGGTLISLLTGNYPLWRKFRDQGAPTSAGALITVARRYSAFPRFELWSNLSNILGLNITILGIGALYSHSSLGQYSLSYRMLTLPAALIGMTASQVYLRELSLRRSAGGSGDRIFRSTLLYLSTLSVAPFIILWVFAPDIFQFVFGPEWREAGDFTRAMMPVIWMRFIMSPLSTTFLVYERQRALLIWQLVILVTTLASFVAANVFTWPALRFAAFNAWALAAVYAGLLAHVYRLTQDSERSRTP